MASSVLPDESVRSVPPSVPGPHIGKKYLFQVSLNTGLVRSAWAWPPRNPFLASLVAGYTFCLRLCGFSRNEQPLAHDLPSLSHG